MIWQTLVYFALYIFRKIILSNLLLDYLTNAVPLKNNPSHMPLNSTSLLIPKIPHSSTSTQPFSLLNVLSFFLFYNSIKNVSSSQKILNEY